MDMDGKGGWMDGWMDGWGRGVGGWMDGWMGGWMDGWMDGTHSWNASQWGVSGQCMMACNVDSLCQKCTSMSMYVYNYKMPNFQSSQTNKVDLQNSLCIHIASGALNTCILASIP